MKKAYFALIISLLCLLPVFSQTYEYENDPLEDGYLIHDGLSQEIVTVDQWGVSIYKYYKEMHLAPWDTLIPVLSYGHEPVYGMQDLITCDLDGDSLSEIINVMVFSDHVATIILKPDPALLSIDTAAQWQDTVSIQKSTPVPYESDNWFLPRVVLVDAGNFDADPQNEFVVAYWADNGTDTGYVNLTVYDVDETLGVTEQGSIMDQPIVEPAELELCEDQMHLFEIECGDFNGDGIDEILLGGRENASPSGWQYFTTIYSYESGTGNLVAQLKDIVYTQPDPNYDVANLNLAIGHFSTQEKEQAIVGFYEYTPLTSRVTDTVSYTIVPFEVNDLLTEINVGPIYIQRTDTLEGGDDCHYSRFSTLVAADANNDDLDEIVSAFSIDAWPHVMRTFQIFQLDTELNLTLWADFDFLLEESSDKGCVLFGDIRAELDEEESCTEFTLSSGYPKYATPLYQITYNADGSFKEIILLIEDVQDLTILGKSEQYQAGDFDSDIRLGKPSRFNVTEILQPLVILNAPPIHFDVLDDQIYDVCFSYNENDPQFISSYVKESSQLTELETEINRDWALSTSVSAGLSFWGVSVSSHFSQTWGEKFNKVDNTTTKVTVSIAVDAIEDDRIFAMVMDYDIWEYPIYVNRELKGNALVVEPHAADYRWFPSKSWSGHSYIPEHEVGNILSYREYPLLSNNPILDEKIKGDYNNSFVLDANSSYNWELQFDDFQSSQSTTTKEYTRDWGVSVSGWGVGFSINGSYHKEDINTQRTEVASGLYLGVHLDGIDMGIGEVGYIVTPYAYWAKNGALVVDYAAKPEISAPGGTPTWWQVNYEDLPDPAFILPWRYDPEKGYNLEEDAKRQQTKDLQFYPANPKDGDEITIKARIHNFSLIPTPGLISVRFYAGNPDSGGVLLGNTSGQTEVFTSQAIPARGTETVEFSWIVIDGLGTFPRIYAVIDEDNLFNEIHENNNKSWAILNKSTGTSIKHNDDGKIPSEFELFQNYPNPFNPVTTIRYQLPKSTYVRLNIYNINGQRITSLANKNQAAGYYEVEWDASAFASGVYIYRLETNTGFLQSRKLVLLK
jgi:hypothetical protein